MANTYVLIQLTTYTADLRTWTVYEVNYLTIVTHMLL